MKTLEIDFRTNFKGADYNYKLMCKCSDVETLRHAQSAINDFFEKQIAKAEKENAN